MEAFVGALDPYALKIDLQSADAAFDLTEATEAVFEVLRERGGDPEEWAATISAPTTIDNGTQITLTHPYQATDLVRPETLKIVPRLKLESYANPIYGLPFRLIVNRKFDG